MRHALPTHASLLYFEHEPYRTIKVVKNLFNNAPLVSNDVVNLL